MFKCYYDPKRFMYIGHLLQQDPRIMHVGNERIRKTASFISEKLNVYIDTSDGVNEDLDIQEYCARILKISKECNGKRFLFFKAAYSPERSSDICKIAEENNGKVIPFFKWSFNDQFYSHLAQSRHEIIQASKLKSEKYDIGFFANIEPYDYPKPNEYDSRYSWRDFSNFGLGSPKNTGDYFIHSREKLAKVIKDSTFSVCHESLDYKSYITKMLSCKTTLNPPGIGEYTSRMFDACFLGRCIVLRKNTYDNGHSWKEYIPEIDFASKTWQNDYQNIIDDIKVWEEKSLYYFENFWSPVSIYEYLNRAIVYELGSL